MEKYKVIVSSNAVDKLTAIASSFDDKKANEILDGFYASILELVEFPKRYPKIMNCNGVEYRSKLYKCYKIIYSVDARTVLIADVLYKRQETSKNIGEH